MDRICNKSRKDQAQNLNDAVKLCFLWVSVDLTKKLSRFDLSVGLLVKLCVMCSYNSFYEFKTLFMSDLFINLVKMSQITTKSVSFLNFTQSNLSRMFGDERAVNWRRLTRASELVLLIRGDAGGCGRALTKPLDSQLITPVLFWLWADVWFKYYDGRQGASA